MAKNFEFKANDVTNFIAWLKKFSSINDSLLLEINSSGNEFVAKSYNEERSVIKFSKLSFSDGGLEVTKSKKDDKRIKIGIHSITKLIKTLKHFSDKEFQFIFKYDTLIEDDNTESLSGQSMLMKNDELKVNIKCTPLNLFKYISDELFKDNIASVTEKFSFSISQEIIDKINSLIKLDADYKYIKFLAKDDGKIYAKSKSFEYALGDSKSDSQEELEILKSQFEKVDVENYICQIGEDRLVFNSNDSETKTVISEVERSDNYEETEDEEFE